LAVFQGEDIFRRSRIGLRLVVRAGSLWSAGYGERNRTLTVVKARGTTHSNQMREVLLSNEGVALAAVYSSGGNVLLGTARLRREQEELIESEQDE
jgi:hypothetical protein